MLGFYHIDFILYSVVILASKYMFIVIVGALSELVLLCMNECCFGDTQNHTQTV